MGLGIRSTPNAHAMGCTEVSKSEHETCAVPLWPGCTHLAHTCKIPDANPIEIGRGSMERNLGNMFSEYGQDEWLLRKVFTAIPWASEGFFVEFGARDGKEHSNSYFFEHVLRWNGILVEPVDTEFSKLISNRPNSYCLHGALCSHSEKRTFLSFDGELAGWSGFEKNLIDKGHMEHVKNVVRTGRSKMIETTVQCHNINEELLKLGVDHVQLFSADCEGCEKEVLESLDWENISVDVFLIERSLRENEIISFLLPKGYVLVNLDSSDLIFVSAKIMQYVEAKYFG